MFAHEDVIHFELLFKTKSENGFRFMHCNVDYRFAASQSTFNTLYVLCTLMTSYERYVFSFIQRDSWKRRSNVYLPFKINYLSHIYLQLLFLEYVTILNYASRLRY